MSCARLMKRQRASASGPHRRAPSDGASGAAAERACATISRAAAGSVCDGKQKNAPPGRVRGVSLAQANRHGHGCHA